MVLAMGPLQIVWFKRDLRVVDHQPLLRASSQGPVLPLVVVEPQLWQQPDASGRQWSFYAESIEELRQALALLGQPLVVRIGPAVQVLERARRRFGIAGLWSHEETGNGWTYTRDKQVAEWAKSHGITWIEIPQFGVIRRLRDRSGWARRWEERMAEPVAPPPISAWRRTPAQTGSPAGDSGAWSYWRVFCRGGGPATTGSFPARAAPLTAVRASPPT